MPYRPAWLLLALVSMLLPACATGTGQARQASPAAAQALLLISVDGLRADALGRGNTPVLDRLAAQGVRAAAMQPSYPVLTFPNHYTLVTGLRPDRHGVVHNSMEDPELGRFMVADVQAGRTPGWWQAEPLWTTAERAGITTGVWAWPGSLAPREGILPHYLQGFDPTVPLPERMRQVAGWLTGSAGPRARLAAVYIETVDGAGHDFGPHSQATAQAIGEMDAAIGGLLGRLEAAGIRQHVDIVVVSDHGMADVPAHQYLAVEDLASPQEARVISVGQLIGLVPNPGFEAVLEARLPGRHANYECWRKQDVPARLHYGRHPRIPPLLCQLDEGWSALGAATRQRRDADGTHDRGAHGYDPDSPTMQAVFLAQGPSFARGRTLPVFANVDLYPLLARLLRIQPRHHDGNADTLLPALATPGAQDRD
jgi:predicted AlkP superfamily pyrophosphatase or phosphodiesterase